MANRSKREYLNRPYFTEQGSNAVAIAEEFYYKAIGRDLYPDEDNIQPYVSGDNLDEKCKMLGGLEKFLAGIHGYSIGDRFEVVVRQAMRIMERDS